MAGHQKVDTLTEEVRKLEQRVESEESSIHLEFIETEERFKAVEHVLKRNAASYNILVSFQHNH